MKWFGFYIHGLRALYFFASALKKENMTMIITLIIKMEPFGKVVEKFNFTFS